MTARANPVWGLHPPDPCAALEKPDGYGKDFQVARGGAFSRGKSHHATQCFWQRVELNVRIIARIRFGDRA